MRLTIGKSIKDDEIIEGCLRGERAAQQDLYEKYASKMLGVCCRYLKDRDEAEDVMIASLMKVFEKLGQFKGEGSFEGWIRRLVINECLTYLRRNKSMHMTFEIETAEREADLQTIADKLEENDLLNLVNSLPIGYRTVFNLYAIEGYSHKEIAKDLDISVNTSKSQLSRARVLLQHKLVEAERIVDSKLQSNDS